MNTIYLFDPLQRHMAILQADLAKRTIDPVAKTPETQPIDEEMTRLDTPAELPERGRASQAYRDHEDPSAYQASDIMSHPLRTIEAEKTVAEARSRMEQMEIRHLAITREGKVIGVCQERSLLLLPPGQDLESLSGPFLIAGAQTPVSTLALLFLGKHASACLIRTERGLEGIVTDHDLMKCLLPPSPNIKT